MFGGPEVSYHQIYSARDWLSNLRTSYPTQNLQRKHRTDEALARAAVTLRRNGSKDPILDVYGDDIIRDLVTFKAPTTVCTNHSKD